MKLKNLFKKILLIFLGLVLSLVFLEVLLQSTSFAIKYIKDFKTYNYLKKIKKEDTVTILCIGESTTHKMYPSYLQQVLDKTDPGRFAVIDGGVPAIMLKNISETIEDTIKKYNPTIVIFMMGINDGFYYPEESEYEPVLEDTNEKDKYSKMPKIKIYRLALLLKMHITELLKTKNYDAEDKNTDEYNKLAQHIASLSQNGEFTKAGEILKEAFDKDPYNEYVYVMLTKIYCDFIADHKIIEIGRKMAIEGLDMDFITDKGFLYKAVLEKYFVDKNQKLLKFYADKAVNESIDVFRSYCGHFIYGFVKDVISDEQKKQIFSVMLKSSELDKTYGIMAIDNLKSGNYSKAEEYFAMAEAIRLNFPNKQTNKLYKSIIQKTVNMDVKTICMQYPVRSVEILKTILKDEDLYNKVIFVSNENIFKETLKKHPYKYVFTDQFAGDFGHCTPVGNQMIAENVAKTIIEITKKTS
ncbi:hypothetical protein MASR1M68_11540 [Elusimicrobiota bacterium]